jgi:nitronate monooxygenase
VPAATLQRYRRCDPAAVIASRAIDGLPQRMIRNELLDALEGAGALRRLRLAGQRAGLPAPQRHRLRPDVPGPAPARRAEPGQALMAANAPMVMQRHGRWPAGRGVLPAGQVAACSTRCPAAPS